MLIAVPGRDAAEALPRLCVRSEGKSKKTPSNAVGFFLFLVEPVMVSSLSFGLKFLETSSHLIYLLLMISVDAKLHSALS